MEGNDIGVAYVARYACRFEGLLMTEEVIVDEPGRVSKLFGRGPTSTVRWVPNDLPLKSLSHLVNNLHVKVMVITYLYEQEEAIEAWLSRKGISVEVVGYDNAYDWAEDLRRNPELRHYFTADPAEQDIIGWQHVTLAAPDRPWGVSGNG